MTVDTDVITPITEGNRNQVDIPDGEMTTPTRVRAYPRVADDPPLESVPVGISVITRGWAFIRDAVWRLAESEPYTSTPASVAEMVAYTRAGGWVRGQRPWWREAPGYLYGAFAVAVTATGHLAIWIVQRPSRVAATALVAWLLGFAWSADALWWWPR